MFVKPSVSSGSWSPTSCMNVLLRSAILIVVALLAGSNLSADKTIFAADQSWSNQWGLGSDQPVPGDYDGDDKADLAVYRPSEGCWYILHSSNGTYKRQEFGIQTDQPVPADYDGDGKTDFAVFRPSNGVWYYLKSSDGSFQAQQFGTSGDIAVPGDFDGDGRSSFAVWRPSTGFWYTSTNPATNYGAVHFGQSGDVPVPADYDGDGKADVTVFRPQTGTFYLLQSSVNTIRAQQWGISTDRPVTGDFDKDGKADFCVFRPSDATWYVIKSSDNNLFGQTWGQGTDRLLPQDYDGNSQTDFAVFSPNGGIWNILLNPVPLPVGTGAQFYVAPNGGPNGNGSITNPWNLRTALNQPSSVQPGATIYLRGGTYKGRYTSRLAGTAAAPITVRSYPGEWAKIDGYKTSTLAVALPATGGDPVTVVFTTNPDFNDSSGVRIKTSDTLAGHEDIFIGGRQPDGVTWTNCARLGGSSIVSHPVGSLAVEGGKNLTINGQYTHYRDFEIINSEPTRNYNFSWGQMAPTVRGSGITVNASTGLKFINLVIHDNQEGIYAAVGAVDMEIYGCILYNNGFVDWQRGHGQGLYMQNQTGQKKIRNIISFNNFTDGMKAYAESGFAQNFLFEHVISFNNGSPSSFPGNNGNNGNPLPADNRYPNIFAGTGNSNNPTNNILIHDCYLYDNVGTSNLSLGYQGIGATGLEITNSRIMGGGQPLGLNNFQSGTVTGNKIYANQSGFGQSFAYLAGIYLVPGYTFTWDNNTYYDQLPQYGGVSYPFVFAGKTACDTGGVLRFTETGCLPRGGWKEVSGFDASSTYNYAAPTATEVFVIPNEYESGRAHIAIYNWALNPTVAVNLSNVLQVGDQYEIYAVEDYFGTPVLTGTYSGGTVAIPMTGTTVSSPIGLGWTPATMRPRFGAFVVRKL